MPGMSCREVLKSCTRVHHFMDVPDSSPGLMNDRSDSNGLMIFHAESIAHQCAHAPPIWSSALGKYCCDGSFRTFFFALLDNTIVPRLPVVLQPTPAKVTGPSRSIKAGVLSSLQHNASNPCADPTDDGGRPGLDIDSVDRPQNDNIHNFDNNPLGQKDEQVSH